MSALPSSHRAQSKVTMNYALKMRVPVWLPDMTRPHAAVERAEMDEGAIQTRAAARFWATSWTGWPRFV